MKEIPRNKLKEIKEENKLTFENIKENGTAKLSRSCQYKCLDFAISYGTKEFQNKLLKIYDSKVEYLMHDKVLYKEYKKQIQLLETSKNRLDIRESTLNQLDKTGRLKQGASANFYYQTDLRSIIKELATEYQIIQGVGLLFKMNRQYYLQPTQDPRYIITLGNDEHYKSIARGRKQEVISKVTHKEVRLMIRTEGTNEEYKTIVNIKKYKKVNYEALTKILEELAKTNRLAERHFRTLDYFKEPYEEDYTKYSRLFEELGNEVQGITNLYECFENPYNNAYIKMKKIKELAEQIREITQPTSTIATIEGYVRYVKEHTTM